MAILKNTIVDSTGALQLPVGTTAQRPASNTAGSMRFNSSFNTVESWTGSRWAYMPDIVRNGLVLHLDAGEPSSYSGSGTTWTDLSGNGNTGTLTNGPTYNSGNGGSIVFDGTNDYIDCGVASQIGSSLNGLTVEVVLYTKQKTTKCIAENGTNFDTNTFYMFQENADYFTFEVYGTNFDLIYCNSIYQTNTWYHLTGTWSSGNRVNFYLNGVLSNGTRNGSVQSTIKNGNTNLMVGSRAGTSFYFDGNIPIARFYNRALSATEIQQNFNAMRGRFGI
jgi:hypothetical protein